MTGQIALVSGVGPGSGSAIVRRLVAGGYEVAMLARNEERLQQLETELSGVKGYPVDVTNAARFDAVLDKVASDLGDPEVVIHNAVGGTFGNFREIDPAVLERNFQVNVMAFLQLARHTAPAMIREGRGVIVASGNTSALRGKANFAGFAPTKAAQRILAESIARDLGPHGIHVAYVLVDAVIDLDWTRAKLPDAPDDFFIQPAAIADEVWHVVHQPRGAWSFNVEVRPFGEIW
jgi:NAD(P)-dependent dehydrogenase (short-subunit alcohol dehydrogenase family)